VRHVAGESHGGRRGAQADTLFALSSVTETLLFTATLRLSKHASDEDRRHRVDEVLAELGLLGCKDTLIGNEQVRRVCRTCFCVSVCGGRGWVGGRGSPFITVRS
jgi:hypothetical protein